ncbi:hypothetical protein GCM10025781_05100 [Kocuria gwangalliensis]|uniref:Uncharacterized protein n=1 Tax=Kocuria gwangalliensis TaxID=501592 RepID=A0ABP8WK46_9MICC
MLSGKVPHGYAQQHNRHGESFDKAVYRARIKSQREPQGGYVDPCIPGLVRFAGCLRTDKPNPVIRRAS